MTSDAFIQTLETRKLFAAQPLALSPVEVVNPNLSPGTPAVEATPESQPVKKGNHAKKADAPAVRSTDLVGEWDGHIKVRFGLFSRKFDLDFSIYNQTSNSISGRVEIDGHEFEGTFFGKINPKNGRFRYTLDDDGEEVTIKGQLGKRGLIIGGGKIDAEDWDGWDWGFEMKGSFEVDKIA